MIRTKISKDPVKTIQDLIQFNESVNQIGKVAEIGQGWKSLKKNMVDYLVNLENTFGQLNFSDISAIEFHTMLQNILQKTKGVINQAKSKNKIHQNDFDFILSVLDAVNISNNNKIQELEEIIYQ